MFSYTKISKNSSAKYYNKYEENLVKYIKIFLKKRKKSRNMTQNDIKIAQKMKNKSQLRIENSITKYEKISKSFKNLKFAEKRK